MRPFNDRGTSNRLSAVSRLGRRMTEPSEQNVISNLQSLAQSKSVPYQSPARNQPHQSQNQPSPHQSNNTHPQRALPRGWQQPQQVIETQKVSSPVSAHRVLPSPTPAFPNVASPAVATKSEPSTSAETNPSTSKADSSVKRNTDPGNRPKFAPKRARAIDLCDI